MKTSLLVAMLAVTATLYSQTPDGSALASPTTGDSTGQLSNPALQASSGVILSAQLIRSIDARKARPGDAIIAKCTQDLRVAGEVLIPRNAKLIGHVVSVQAKGRGKPESFLAIAVDKAILRDGRDVPLSATVQALAPPAIMASEVGDTNLGIRNVRPAKPPTTALLPGRKTAPVTILAPAPTANSTTVTGLNGLQLEAVPSVAAETSVIHSSSRNVRLESGTRLILRVSFP